ncbi:MAG: L-aspartate oxidase [Desulfovibrio sp.]|jgi:L-aspartate oxidase|nr:L-aspartate oxidase [Desulfovibrio sp.]
MSAQRKRNTVLVIGSGLAGCITALRVADQGIDVMLLSSAAAEQGANSWLAQGGIIYRSPDKDDARRLEEDIMTAGHAINHAAAVRLLADEGPRAVDEILIDRLGVSFDRKDSAHWDLTREAGHSSYRILHCADHTGRDIMQSVYEAVRRNPCITVCEGYAAVDLLTSHHHSRGMTYRYQLEDQCCGAYVLNVGSGEVETVLADITVLATGGAGQVYLHSSNARTAVGAGISMAGRAFARLMNMEFVQFHPTTLFYVEPQRFLITEALRGEGARLFAGKGDYFMERYDSRGDLAPRDIVSRAIVDVLLRNGEPCVFLDLTGVKQDLEERFPTVLQNCLDRGINIRSEPIPVVPAAHYFCGGILVDLRGRTSLKRLYSVGECACTGVHGANRLASTSLLEALLWGKVAGDDISLAVKSKLDPCTRLYNEIEDWWAQGDERNDDPALIAQDWATIRNTMWNYVGITRTGARLTRAFEDLRDLSRHIHEFYRSATLSRPVVDLFHGCQTAYLITQAALRNSNDIGCHHRI